MKRQLFGCRFFVVCIPNDLSLFLFFNLKKDASNYCKFVDVLMNLFKLFQRKSFRKISNLELGKKLKSGTHQQR